MNKLQAVMSRRWPVVVAAFLLGALAGVVSGLGAAGQAGDYEAEQVIVANQVTQAQTSVLQDALKVTRGRVPVAAAERLGRPDDAQELAEDVSATADEQSRSITVSASSETPEQAVETVNAFTEAFLEIVNADLSSEGQRQLEDLQATVDQAEASIDEFDTKHPEITQTDQQLVNSATVSVLVNERRELVAALSAAREQYDTFRISFNQRQPYSTLGEEPPKLSAAQLLKVPTSPVFRAAFLGVLGAMLGFALVFALERLNRRIDTRAELAEVTKAPVIAEVPRLRRKARAEAGLEGRLALDGPLSEHYRRVRSTIQFIQNQHVPTVASSNGNGSTGSRDKVFLFTSAMPDEGKSTSAALTALALAESGAETLVVDADFRKPSMVERLGLAPSPNLEDLARAGLSQANIHATVQAGPVPHLWAAVTGPPANVVFHRLVAARGVIAEGATRGGTVVVDSAPLSSANDTIDLLPAVDHVILVVRAGRAKLASVKSAIEVLDNYGASLAGIVLIGAREARERTPYYGSADGGGGARTSPGFSVVAPRQPTS